MEDGIAVADGGTGDQLCGGGDAIAVEVRCDLQLIGCRLEVGDRVVARGVLRELVDIGSGAALHVVVADIVDKRRRAAAEAAEHVVVAGAGFERVVAAGAREEDVAGTGAADQRVAACPRDRQQRVAPGGGQRHIGVRGVGPDLVGIEEIAVGQLRADLELRIGREERVAARQQPGVGLHRIGLGRAQNGDDAGQGG